MLNKKWRKLETMLTQQRSYGKVHKFRELQRLNFNSKEVYQNVSDC